MRNQGQTYCDSCLRIINSEIRVGKPRDPICDSALAGSGDIELCLQCSTYEEEQIEKEGTNFIPKLLGHYNCSKSKIL